MLAENTYYLHFCPHFLSFVNFFLSFVNFSSICAVIGNGQASSSVPAPQSPVARTTLNPIPR